MTIYQPSGNTYLTLVEYIFLTKCLFNTILLVEGKWMEQYIIDLIQVITAGAIAIIMQELVLVNTATNKY